MTKDGLKIFKYILCARWIFRIHCKKEQLIKIRLSLFRSQVSSDNIVRVNYCGWSIIHFRTWLFHYDFVFKMCFRELREGGVYKLTLISTPKWCGTSRCTGTKSIIETFAKQKIKVVYVPLWSSVTPSWFCP